MTDRKQASSAMAWTHRLLIVPPIVIGVAAILMAPMFKGKLAQTLPEERAAKVRVIKASPMDVVARAVGYGLVIPARTWDSAAEVDGQVAWISDDLKTGREVAAGTELLRLQDADYRLMLAQAEAQLNAADVKIRTTRASLAIAEKELKLLADDLARKKALAAKGAASQVTVEAAERQMLAGQSQVQNLRNTLELSEAEKDVYAAQRAAAELDMARTRISAPFDVRLTQVNIGEAQYANRGQLLFSADGLDAAEVDAKFPIGQLRPLVRAAQAETEDPAFGVLSLNAVVRLRAASHVVEWPAQVDRAAGLIDPETQSIGVVARIDDPVGKAEPGNRPRLLRNTFVEVELSAPALQGRTVIPRAAVHDGKVFIADAENRLEIRPVEILFAQGTFVVLAGGIERGERIVTSELISAVEDMLLEPVEDRKLKRALVTEATGAEPAK